HQSRDQFQVLDAACPKRRLDMLADGAIADQAELQGHDSFCSTQRAQAMSRSSLSRGPTSCTDNGRPSGPGVNGNATEGVPRRVQNRLKRGSPVLPRPDGASPLAEGASRMSNLLKASSSWARARRLRLRASAYCGRLTASPSAMTPCMIGEKR